MHLQSPKLSATVITDASYCDKRKVGGWAAWVRIDGVPDAIKGYGTLNNKHPNSGVSEVQAALNGMWMAGRLGAVTLLVRSDCMAVQHLIRGECKNKNLLNTWQTTLVHLGIDPNNIVSKHVKGHTDGKTAATWVNNWCDKHAKIGLKHARSGRKFLELS